MRGETHRPSPAASAAYRFAGLTTLTRCFPRVGLKCLGLPVTSASAPPATPTGYAKIDVGGTTYVVPYYAAA